jgi:hypothetical protein
MPRWEPPREQVVEKPKPRRWPAVVLLLAILAVAGYGLWMMMRRLHPAPRQLAAAAADVRSSITAAGDSLEVGVSWEFRPGAGGVPDSMRVEVGRGDGSEARAHVIGGSRRSDTLRLAPPIAGETVSGYSCVAAVHAGRLAPESCTPWQYVQPSAEVAEVPDQDSAAPTPRRAVPAPSARTAEPRVTRIVIQPAGQPVVPDIGGKCAAWQRAHPGRSVWIDVNRKAVPECMGPNGKPTVVQFCAFALLSDGRRVTTRNSSDIPYCESLFEQWVRERVT